jgi:hypothetical protein
MKCLGLQEKVQGRWLSVGNGGKIGELRQIYSKFPVLVNSISLKLCKERISMCRVIMME